MILNIQTRYHWRFGGEKMIYTREEKRRIERLLAAFDDYLTYNEEYDVAYSKRSGYVLLVIAECGENVFFPLMQFDQLLDALISSMAGDAETDMLIRQTPAAVARFRRVCGEIREILDTLGEDREEAVARLDAYMVENIQKAEM